MYRETSSSFQLSEIVSFPGSAEDQIEVIPDKRKSNVTKKH
jgi:hypothetical protein